MTGHDYTKHEGGWMRNKRGGTGCVWEPKRRNPEIIGIDSPQLSSQLGKVVDAG